MTIKVLKRLSSLKMSEMKLINLLLKKSELKKGGNFEIGDEYLDEIHYNNIKL